MSVFDLCEFSASDICAHYDASERVDKPRDRLIFERLVAYLSMHDLTVKARNIVEAVNILISAADTLASNAHYNSQYIRWMDDCSREFVTHCKGSLVGEHSMEV